MYWSEQELVSSACCAYEVELLHSCIDGLHFEWVFARRWLQTVANRVASQTALPCSNARVLTALLQGLDSECSLGDWERQPSRLGCTLPRGQSSLALLAHRRACQKSGQGLHALQEKYLGAHVGVRCSVLASRHQRSLDFDSSMSGKACLAPLHHICMAGAQVRSFLSAGVRPAGPGSPCRGAGGREVPCAVASRCGGSAGGRRGALCDRPICWGGAVQPGRGG